MPFKFELIVPVDHIQNEEWINTSIRKRVRNPEQIKEVKILKRSIDARKRKPVYRLQIEVWTNEKPEDPKPELFSLSTSKASKEVIVIGAGPAGYFAALELIQLGLKPIVFDRGKSVRDRRKDLRAIQQFGEVNAESNYCFGEGGAGTYSDGKLYTRSLKRGNYERVLRILVQHGAAPIILEDAHPHIGSNKLPGIVSNIRETICEAGGEVHFDSKITDFIIENNQIKGVIINNNKEHFANAFILATGHSARDIYYLLDKKKIHIEPKDFALGLRAEHPQALIDEIQYKQNPRHKNLPAASYKLVCQINGKGVFSFCMCPGGLIVPAATSPGEIVVNGMSLSRRDSKFANSGIVVAVNEKDLIPFKKHGVFAGLKFQESVEQAMFNAGDGSQKAPAQRLKDFSTGKLSSSLNDTSYIPGIFSAPLHQLLPKTIAYRLRKGFGAFDNKMKGYFTNEANVVGVESRTSSPFRIPRNKITFMHEQIQGLFPCGEGAGYAGGILSAAMDGQNVAKAVNRFLS